MWKLKPEAWALLQNAPKALQALRQAADWLFQAIGNTAPLGPLVEDWDAWCLLIQQSPGRWKGYIKRATAWHQECCHVVLYHLRPVMLDRGAPGASLYREGIAWMCPLQNRIR